MSRVTITGRSESDTDIASVLRGYVDRFELTSPMVKNMMLDAAAEIERLRAALKKIADQDGHYFEGEETTNDVARAPKP